MKTRNRFALLALLLVTPLAISEAGEKQKEKPYALLQGNVFTAEGFALPGIEVSVKREDDRKAKWRAVSNSRGEFAVRLPAGAATYEVSTHSKQFENQTKTVEVAGGTKESVVVVFRLARKGEERGVQR